MKYVILKDGAFERSHLFSPFEKHSDVAERLTGGQLHLVTAAGFVRLRGIGIDAGDGKSLSIEAYGESESLRIPSRPEQDAKVIGRDLNWPH